MNDLKSLLNHWTRRKRGLYVLCGQAMLMRGWKLLLHLILGHKPSYSLFSFWNLFSIGWNSLSRHPIILCVADVTWMEILEAHWNDHTGFRGCKVKVWFPGNIFPFLHDSRLLYDTFNCLHHSRHAGWKGWYFLTFLCTFSSEIETFSIAGERWAVQYRKHEFSESKNNIIPKNFRS